MCSEQPRSTDANHSEIGTGEHCAHTVPEDRTLRKGLPSPETGSRASSRSNVTQKTIALQPLTVIGLHFHAFESITLKLCFGCKHSEKKELLESISIEFHTFCSQQHFINLWSQNSFQSHVNSAFQHCWKTPSFLIFTDTYRFVHDIKALHPQRVATEFVYSSAQKVRILTASDISIPRCS